MATKATVIADTPSRQGARIFIFRLNIYRFPSVALPGSKRRRSSHKLIYNIWSGPAGFGCGNARTDLCGWRHG